MPGNTRVTRTRTVGSRNRRALRIKKKIDFFGIDGLKQFIVLDNKKIIIINFLWDRKND